MFVFGEMPTLLSIGGIALVAAGALVMNWHKEQSLAGTRVAELKQRNRQGVVYFLATAAKVAIRFRRSIERGTRRGRMAWRRLSCPGRRRIRCG